MMDLADLYDGISQEFGFTPLVVYPQGYNPNSITIEVGGEESESYWLLVERGNQSDRQIIWLVGGVKPISETEAPSAHDCPLFLLELAPEVKNRHWRDAVERYWKLKAIDEPFRGKCNHAFLMGDNAHCGGYSRERNPHNPSSPLYGWWSDGWEHAQRHYPNLNNKD
ncbi:hypothetical protein AAFX24_28320 [Vibrio mediterranei]|uniref:hypothetical protein n=1 Tax=Vibrio mediterranei TaxID=689 RepID=UPI0038CEECFA